MREKFDPPADETIELDHTPPKAKTNFATSDVTNRIDLLYFEMLGMYGVPRYPGVPSVQSVVEEKSG